MATSGQTLNDRINAARYALAGQGLARCVCKATTEEIIGPKKKHLDYLLACTHEPNVSIPQLANLLIERTNHMYWVVVFKALVTVHHLMSYGNERFIQYLASSNYSLELSTFIDKTAARDFSMSTYIRRYSAYINEKALSYRLLAFDFCKVKRGNQGVLRLMPIDRLLKTLPILHKQLNALLEFNCSANNLNNGVINACFMLLFRDLIGLFACYNDGIINLLERYFTLNRKMCREALDLYKNFLRCMESVSEFLVVAEAVGMDKEEIPDLRKAPSSLVDALEEHLKNIESNKKILKQPGTSSGESAPRNLTPPPARASAQVTPDATASAFAFDPPQAATIHPDLILAFDPAPTAANQANLAGLTANNQSNSTGLSTSNHATLGGPSTTNHTSLAGLSSTNHTSLAGLSTTNHTDLTGFPTNNHTNLAGLSTANYTNLAGFPSANYTNLGGFDKFDDLLQPISASGKETASSSSTINSNKPLASTGLFKGDLDSTLANLAQNLTFEGISKTKK